MPRSDRQRNYALFRVRPQLLIKSRFAELRHIQSLTFTLSSYIFPTRGCTICEVTSIIQTKNTLPLCLLMAVALKTVGNRKRECDPTGNNKNITRTRDTIDHKDVFDIPLLKPAVYSCGPRDRKSPTMPPFIISIPLTPKLINI